MMLLGLVIHSAMAYVTFPTDRVWPFKDPHPSAFFDILVMFIHTFRMPVFFVIAGFFAAFLYTTRGANTLFHNRAQRIALPLACGWIILFPLVIIAAGFAQARSSYRSPSIRTTSPSADCSIISCICGFSMICSFSTEWPYW